MRRKFYLTVLANLALGNLILYFHEINGRHQAEVSSRLWLSFSVVSLLLTIVCLRLLKTRSSWILSLLLSLGFSFLVPAIGFYVGMNFSSVALILASAYLINGFFFLIFPMFVLNFLLFRWNQRL